MHPTRLTLGLAVSGLALALTACQQTGGPAPVPETPAAQRSYSVAPGGTVRLDSYAHFDAACQTTGFADFEAGEPPRLGALRVGREDITIRNVSGAAREDCVGRALPGVAADYVAGPVAGVDRFSLIRTNRHGRTRETQVSVTIR